MLCIPSLGQWYVTLFTIFFVLICVFLILVILIQRPRGGGLSGAFGGAGGGSQSVFGAKTGDVLTWFTVICFTLFVGLAMALTWSARPAGDADADTPKVTETEGKGDADDAPSLLPPEMKDGKSGDTPKE